MLTEAVAISQQLKCRREARQSSVDGVGSGRVFVEPLPVTLGVSEASSCHKPNEERASSDNKISTRRVDVGNFNIDKITGPDAKTRAIPLPDRQPGVIDQMHSIVLSAQCRNADVCLVELINLSDLIPLQAGLSRVFQTSVHWLAMPGLALSRAQPDPTAGLSQDKEPVLLALPRFPSC